MKKITFFVFLALVLASGLSIGQNSMKIIVKGNDTKCNGDNNGSAQVTAIGGKAPYTYSWSPLGATTSLVNGLAPGIYSVTVIDNNGISAKSTITIKEPAPLLVSIDSIVVRPCFVVKGGVCGCNNTLWAVVNGGTAPYSYAWTPNGDTTDTLRHVCYQTFRVTVSDNNQCITSDSLD
ncbi:MAG TPA: SprB repeat-containing protein, partial [Bacteroidia bacterium]|nr:SprB repeat-containing protein [Bacteroidia bacterium]